MATVKQSPTIHIFGQSRKEGITFPVLEGSHQKTNGAKIVYGGVDLMQRDLMQRLLSKPNEASKENEACKENEASKPNVKKTYFNVSVHHPSSTDTNHSPSILGLDSIATLRESTKESTKEPNTTDLGLTKYTVQKKLDLKIEKAKNGIKYEIINETENSPKKIVVFSDHGLKGLADTALNMLENSEVQLLIYQMPRPLEKETLKNILKTKKDAWLKKLVVVVDADDLRAEGIQISRYFSWEKTMKDFHEHFVKDFGLQSSVHLLVRCGYEGVFYWRGNEVNLYLTPSMAEGDLIRSCDGPILGLETAFIAALTQSLATSSLSPSEVLSDNSENSIKSAVKHAISWSHYFAAIGFRKDDKENIDYPSANDISQSKGIRFTTISVDFKTNESPPKSIFAIDENREVARQVAPEAAREAARELARKIVKKGLEKIVVPIARFGALVTADRVEIECFRATGRVIDEYLHSTRIKPLSIGVFGPPGSGKSFGVRQVVQSVAKDFRQPIKELEVNLSQFLEYSDLLAIFHTIRDITLRGEIPIVLFDEFDASFKNNPLGWLKYFLAPMQDGNFLDNGQVRPLGRGIFIFIGGTSSTFKEFTTDIEAQAQAQARAAKKPDFVSRLSGYIDIRGPNMDGKDDKMYYVRRAIVLHTMLEKILGKKDDINIDEGVLNAFLEVPEFHHGVRSIETILNISSLNGYDKFMAASLPSDDQLSMHVDVKIFKELLKSAGVSQG
ncbi:1d819d3b-0677-4269-a0f7-1ae4b957d4fe [Sclerotinia trifoliorum]|uniref:1d819d3b-0677-4269-a0f7-1ae4b957d4fe n=1 Tax=Sclerotinia trifoliorum TaxID=28548 RepID=A0A8H2W5V1_9HELO|nr:1d819d3b-0677-4269-a0f7-1ae4b957d4fe [Sclerotinia trifoliorum]